MTSVTAAVAVKSSNRTVESVMSIQARHPGEAAVSLAVGDLVALLFEIRHAGVEIVSDARPAEFDDENKNWQSDGADNQNRLEADGAALVTMNSADQPAKCGEVGHGLTPVSETHRRLLFYMNGQQTSAHVI